MATTAAPITVKQWLKLPEEQFKRTELIDGEIVHLAKTNAVHDETIKNLIAEELVVYLRERQIGQAYVETAFALTPDLAPVPDVSVLLPNRSPSLKSPFRGSPEIVIEVISSDEAKYVVHKRERYFGHGAKLVAEVYPEERSLWVYRADGTGRRFGAADVFAAPDLLPDFSLELRALFAEL